MKQIIFFIIFFFIFSIPVSVLSVEVAPRISDREIIEKLVGLEAGQAALNRQISILREDMKSGQDALRSEMKSGQDALRSEMKSGQDALRSEMKSGQDALRSEMKSGQDTLRSEMNQRFENLERQYDRIWNLILIVIAGIMGLIGFIIWDRKTASKPLEKKIIELEANLLRDLELRHEQGSLPTRLMYALRKLAENNSELSTILRNFSLL